MMKTLFYTIELEVNHENDAGLLLNEGKIIHVYLNTSLNKMELIESIKCHLYDSSLDHVESYAKEKFKEKEFNFINL